MLQCLSKFALSEQILLSLLKYSFFTVIRMGRSWIWKLMSICLTNKSVLSSPSIILMFRSKKLTSSLEYSAVNYIVGWNKLTWSIKTFSDSSPCSQMKICHVCTSTKSLLFFFKSFRDFFLKISHKKNSIRRHKLHSNSGSTFLCESYFIKLKRTV